MSCEKWLPLIEEYLDGELDETSVKQLRGHMASCQDCAIQYNQLRREQDLYQSYVRDLEVTPALWAGVQARIRQDGAGPGLMERLRRLALAFTSGPRLSPVYAMLLVILAVAITVVVMRRGQPKHPGDNGIAHVAPSPSPSRTPSPSVSPESREPVPSPKQPEEPQLAVNHPKAVRPSVKPVQPTAEQAVRDAEQKYIAAIAILSRDVNKHRSELDPAVAAKFEATLASIDFTIKETRRAVREHPGDPAAAHYMLAAYSEKLDVLREMAGQ